MQEILEGRIDFIGQQRAEKVMRNVLVTATVVSFVAGIAMQSVGVTFWVIGASTAGLVGLVVPGWGMYRQDGVEWLGGK